MTPERAREMAEFVHDYIENLDPSIESREKIVSALEAALLAADKPVEGAELIQVVVVKDLAGNRAAIVVDGDDVQTARGWAEGCLAEETTHRNIIESYLVPVPEATTPVVPGRVVG